MEILIGIYCIRVIRKRRRLWGHMYVLTDMRLTQREKEMADMFEQMSKDEQEIMIEFAKRLRTEDPKELVKEINQRLDIDDE